MNASDRDHEVLLQSLTSRGAIVRRSKSGTLHTLDARALAERFSDDDLRAVSGIEDLRKLELDGCAITDVGAAHLSSLSKLKHLDLQRTQITDASLDILAGMQNLQFLLLTGARVSRPALDQLRKTLIGTRIVFL